MNVPEENGELMLPTMESRELWEIYFDNSWLCQVERTCRDGLLIMVTHIFMLFPLESCYVPLWEFRRVRVGGFENGLFG